MRVFCKPVNPHQALFTNSERHLKLEHLSMSFEQADSTSYFFYLHRKRASFCRPQIVNTTKT